jgi:RND family efflux transporter MFP subunit
MFLPSPAAARRLPPLLALALCLAPGCAKPPEEEQPPPAVVVWKTASVTFLEEWTEFAGTTVPLPDRVARITSPVEGKVAAVLAGEKDRPVVEGQKVEPGTALVKLDTTIAEANLAKLVSTQEALQAEEESARADTEVAERELKRLQDLKKTETSGMTIVPKPDLDRAAGAAKSAQAKLKAAGLRTVAGAKEVDAARTQLSLFTLTAPIAGRLGRVQVAVGQTLSVGTPVAEVVDVDEQIDVLCFVPPRLIGRVKVGQQAHTGGADRKPEDEAPGEVVFVADQAEADTGNFAVKVRFANADKHLRANSVVRLSLLLKEGKECVSLPETAVQQDSETPTVVVVTDIKTEKNKEGKEETKGVARRVQAQLGLKSRHQHQIEIVRLIDVDEEEPGKPKPQYEFKNDQWYVVEYELKDGQRREKSRDVAQFVTEGAEGVQSGDVVKFKVEED